MKVVSALLCDAASVREGLLFVMGGGITRLWREEYPSQLACALAIMLELHPMELGRPHEIEVLVQDADGHEMARAKGGFQLGRSDRDLEPGETALVPFTLNLHQVPVPAEGTYTVEVAIDGQFQHTMRVSARYVVDPSPPTEAA